MVSCSFGREVVALEGLQQAVATFAQRACEKLRSSSLQANGVWVWCNTNPFKPDTPQYHPSGAMPLIAPTSDTREVLRLAQHLVRAMYRQGYRHKKAGVGLLDLTRGDHQQGDLFAQAYPRSNSLNGGHRTSNARFGRGALWLASSAWRPRNRGMNQAAQSERLTTSRGELPVAR